MNTEEQKEQSKGLGRWMILGVAVLVAGVSVIMLWLKPSGEIPELQDTQTTGTMQNQADPWITAPTAPTDDKQTSDPGTVPPEPTVTSPDGTSTDVTETQPTESDAQQPIPSVPVSPETQLICEDYGMFSGSFVEDGSDEPVQNVAALLITNGSDQYLDLAELIYELDGQKAVFLVTGLPAGSSAWVLESTRMTASAETRFQHKNSVTSFRKDAVNTLDGVSLEFNGTMLKATNTTDRTFQDVTVYYKALHHDGNYLGGITYMTTFGDLEPGQSAEKLAGHFQPEKCQIVRIGYLEA